MYGKIDWTHYNDDIGGIKFKNSMSLEPMSTSEVNRFSGFGVPIKLVDDAEGRRVLALSYEDYHKEVLILQNAKLAEIKKQEEAEKERLATIELEKLKEAGVQQNLLQELRKELHPNDLKLYLESLNEQARILYPKVAQARESLIELLEKKADEKKIETASKKLNKLRSEFDEACRK